MPAVRGFQRLWCESMLFRHVFLSLLGWGLMYAVFYVEVSRFDWQSQHAKLSITPLGFPLGLVIQWLVFRDNLRAILGSMSLKKAVKRHGTRWLVVKALSFGANQLGYAVALHLAGLPFWLAYPVAAATLSLVYFAVNRFWVLKPPPQVVVTEIA